MRRIEIVGGGPAGLAAGLALVRSGVPVTVLEAGGYPRHRVCGEFIAGLRPSTVDALGLRPILGDARAHDSVTYVVRGRALRPYPLPATAWGISRHTLDQRLANAFSEAGGDLRTGTRADLAEAPPGRVFAAGRRRRGPLWVGLKVHVRAMALANDFEVHLGDRAYVGLSRTESGEVNACGLFGPQAAQERGLDLLLSYLRGSGLGGLADRIRAADPDLASFCATAAPLGDSRVGDTDGIWIGDACASIAPFTGNGLAMALQGAETALGPLRDYAAGLASWTEAVRRTAAGQRRRFRRRLLASWLLHPFLLQPVRQNILAGLVSARLLPFRGLYALVH
jgi:flavin-dependent dehydrogenase